MQRWLSSRGCVGFWCAAPTSFAVAARMAQLGYAPVCRLGAGGLGEVWHVSATDGRQLAIKRQAAAAARHVFRMLRLAAGTGVISVQQFHAVHPYTFTVMSLIRCSLGSTAAYADMARNAGHRTNFQDSDTVACHEHVPR